VSKEARLGKGGRLEKGKSKPARKREFNAGKKVPFGDYSVLEENRGSSSLNVRGRLSSHEEMSRSLGECRPRRKSCSKENVRRRGSTTEPDCFEPPAKEILYCSEQVKSPTERKRIKERGSLLRRIGSFTSGSPATTTGDETKKKGRGRRNREANSLAQVVPGSGSRCIGWFGKARR